MATEEQTIESMIDAALEISREWDNTVELIKAAFESGNEVEALRLAKELCGYNDEAGDRVN